MSAHPGPPRPRPALGMTIVYCGGEACTPADLPVRDRLREVVRRSRHAVLMRAPCVLGALGCPAGLGSGARRDGLIVVQPCSTAERDSRGAAIPIGPVRTPADLDTVCAWLLDGGLDPGTLPERLRYRIRRPQPQLN